MSNHDWLGRAEGVRPSEAMIRGISALIMAAFASAIMFMEELAMGLARILDVLGAIRNFFTAFIEAPIIILTDTARYVAFTLTQGEWAFFGPLTLAVGVGSIAVAFWVWYLFDPPIPLPGFLNRIVNRDKED